MFERKEIEYLFTFFGKELMKLKEGHFKMSQPVYKNFGAHTKLSPAKGMQ